LATSDARRPRPVRTLVLFTVLTVLLPFAGLVTATMVDGAGSDNPGGASLTPALALDLEGGTQIILTPTATDGSAITDESIEQSIDVIRQRIDANGVTEAEITRQGGQNIVVGIPGDPDQATVDLVSQPAQMRFRPVLAYEMGTPAPDVDPSADPSGEPAEEPPAERGTPADASDLAWITPEVQEQFDALDCTDEANLRGGGGGGDDPAKPLVACTQDGSLKYVLGPVEVAGSSISSASSGLMPGPNGTVTNEWGVFLELDSQGAEQFAQTSQRLFGFGQGDVRNQFAIVLDGLVVSAPGITTPITDGRAQISGSFTAESAATLANQLSFGALPLQFEVQSQETISATLGSEQLRTGLIAGLIGLLLVVVYSLFQYRTLGLLTVASLVVAGAITYVAIALLSYAMDYRLSLPGVAGLIVAIGFTADSFIVYFERIRDELRNGRSLRSAVERGWLRARRTIYAAKAVNLISAVILYYLAVGGVQGFAFTLGLTTIIDVMVVVWFTHPVMVLLTKVPFFRDGHRLSGFNRERLTISGTRARYAGAGRVAMSATIAEEAAAEAATGAPPSGSAPGGSATPSRGPLPAAATDASGGRLTIAERRAAERRATERRAAERRAAETEEGR